MSERNGSTTTGSGTAEIPVVRPAGSAATPASPAAPPSSPAAPPSTGPTTQSATPPVPEPAGEKERAGGQATAPVTVRPAPRMPRRGPLTVMGPWAPVAGGLLGLVLGGIVAAILGGVAESYEQRLSLVFVVLGLGMLGTAGTLLADEVRMLRQRARDAAVRPQWVEATAGLVNGLTPARLLLLSSIVVLVVAAYVAR
ncbi:hypothetical protein [Blastococcus sp. CCUG 61487]|uniref:hypothetical protein n=1 Tax=Blastococcus sp. CCUG 61487 TaxID=1840703 RepID=UPI0010C0AA86|nr:hypothetical protein [Blastococcus sp. CCUG 61487]TKJ19742.1 hypothetical protein A6V29_09840 [Blastococcus sp. CCUG 61487]